MNGKKAKLLRRLAKSQGNYKKEQDLKIGKKVKKMVHTLDSNNQPKLVQVERIVAINVSKIEYRRLKRSYKNGEFTI